MQEEATFGLNEVYITNVTPAGDAFAATKDGKGVYITPTLASRFNVETGQVRKVGLVDNAPEFAEKGVPHRAYYIVPEGAPSGAQPSLPGFEEVPPPEKKPNLELDAQPAPVRVLEEIKALRYMSTSEVAQALGWDAVRARNLLDKLHHEGALVRADVYAKHSQIKASKTLWARTVGAFDE